MLGITHGAITKLIAEELKLKDRETSLLVTGSMNPDSWMDFPHHKGKSDEIVRRIMNTRRKFSQEDDECFIELGVALHYIQDKWTMRPRIGDKHTKYERSMKYAVILSNNEFEELIKKANFPTKAEKSYIDFLKTLENGIEKRNVEEENLKRHSINYYVKPDDVHSLLGKIIDYALQERPTTWSNPNVDVNFAFRICLEVSRYVLIPFRSETDDVWFDKEVMKQLEQKEREKHFDHLSIFKVHGKGFKL